MSNLEVIDEKDGAYDVKITPEQEAEEARAKKLVEEIKAANEEYRKLDASLREKRSEVEKLQQDAYTALQRATGLNEQYNMTVNARLLQERNKLQEEVEKLRGQFEKSLKLKK